MGLEVQAKGDMPACIFSWVAQPTVVSSLHPWCGPQRGPAVTSSDGFGKAGDPSTELRDRNHQNQRAHVIKVYKNQCANISALSANRRGLKVKNKQTSL